MADGAVASPAANGPLKVSDTSGTIYVIDLIGFSQMTESRMAMDARRGTETITRLVTDLFSQLMHALSHHDLQFGGLAGDALIAWQSHRAHAISEPQLQTLAMQVCDAVWPGLKCRTAKAEGRFWLGEIEAGDQTRPLLWGPAISAAFEALAHKTRTQGTASNPSFESAPHETLTTATVTDRWSIVFRALSPKACQTAMPEAVAQSIERVVEICEAYAASVDNIVQDDKGLLVIIVLPPAAEQHQSTKDALLNSLTTGRDPVASAETLRSRYGTLFRYSPVISGQVVTITIGHSINQAAKALAGETDAALPDKVSSQSPPPYANRATIGRESETVTVLESLEAADTRRQATGLIGPAGIGKSTIINALKSQSAQNYVQVEVTPGSRVLPFGAAQDLAEACDLSASVVFDPAGQSDLATALPATLIIENWQWCDRDSKRLIRRLHEDRSSGLLLVSSRNHIDGLALDTQIDVAPFNLGQSEQLLETLAPGLLSTGTKRSLHEVTSGTPFWLVQAGLHYASQPSGSTTLDGRSGLEALLSARAEHLTDPAIALWRLFCAWRRPLAFERAKRLLERFDVAAKITHLQELMQLGWIASDPAAGADQYRPTHDILAVWGSSDIPVSFEQALHSTVARALTRTHDSPSRIAQHWQDGGQDLRAAVWYDRAANEADRAGAHALTLDHLGSSAHLSKSAERLNDVRALDHLARTATAMWGVGKLRRAKQALLEFDATAKTIPNSARKRDALLRAATIQSEVGQFAANSALMTSGIYRGWRNSGREDAAYEVKARRQGFIYYALGLMRLPIDGRLKTLVETAHEEGEYRSQAVIGCAAATLNMIRCEWDRAEETLKSCHTAIAQTDDRQMLGVTQCLLGLCHLFQGHSTAALEWFERVAETGREQDHQMFQVWGAYAKAEAHLYAGEWQAAKRLGLEARASAIGLGDHQSVCIIEGTLAQVFAAEQDFDLARKHARNAMRFAVRIPPTNFSTLEGMAAPAQVGVMLQQLNPEDRALEQMIKKGRQTLKKYAQVIRMAQPRHLYVEGLVAGANNDLRTAQRLFNKAHDRAEAYGMRYEQNLAISALNSIQETRHGATA